MPKLELPTMKDFLDFQTKMLKLGFKRIGKKEFKNDFHRLGLIAPRTKVGREAGFDFFANNLRVKVWTTFVEEIEQARPSDLGWVLITKGDDAQYFAHPMRRTKNFFFNLFLYAKACKERIENRPACKDKKCRRLFVIKKGKGGSRYWACSNTEYHGSKPPREDWDYGLSEQSKEFVEKEREEKKRYRDKRREEGKTVGRAKIIRKKFLVTMPQNLEK